MSWQKGRTESSPVSKRPKQPPSEPSKKKADEESAHEDLERISSLSDEELDAELRAAGVDPGEAKRVADELLAKVARERGIIMGDAEEGADEREGEGEGEGERAGEGGERPWRRWVLLLGLTAAAVIAVLLLARRDRNPGVAGGAPSARATQSPPPAPSDPPRLPDAIPGFAAGPLAPYPGFARRTYTRAGGAGAGAGAAGSADASVTVTVARLDLGPGGYDQWVAQSETGYPQATEAETGLSPSRGNGFYDCADAAAGPCALLLQLRSGLHVEIRGDGAATRPDLAAVAAGLGLGEL
jgi:hypothetical protein